MVPIVEYERKKFHLSEVAFNQLHRIMEETQDYQKTNFENARGTVSICCKE